MLTSKDVLVIDEAGMVGTRQLERVVAHAAEAGAKLVLVGDPRQLQAIEAGAAFRAIHERHGGVEITEVRRQREDWQRHATRDLATGKVDAAIGAYAQRDHVHAAETREAARLDLIGQWDSQRRDHPEASRIILTHTNAEVQALNEAARGRMRAAGDLGEDVALKVERGERIFAAGDRIMFLKNERGLEVKNGTLATIEAVSPTGMMAKLDDGRHVSFDLKDYAHVDHGYAATIHKAQGMTVDRTHVLATPGLDAHGSYVALSRHRDGVELHYGRDDFRNRQELADRLGRDRSKDMATDYASGIAGTAVSDPVEGFAERRGIVVSRKIIDMVRGLVPERLRDAFDGFVSAKERDGPAASTPEPVRPVEQDRPRGRFDGLRLRASGLEPTARSSSLQSPSPQPSRSLPLPEPTVSPSPQPGRFAGLKLGKPVVPEPKVQQDTLGKAVERYAKAFAEEARMVDRGLPPLEMHKAERAKAGAMLEALQPQASRDLDAAFVREPGLISKAANGRTNNAIRQLQLEAELRVNPELRAERFTADWQARARQFKALEGEGRREAAGRVREDMKDMAKQLARDPQLESLLRGQKRLIGMGSGEKQSVSRELQDWLGRSRDRGLGR